MIDKALFSLVDFALKPYGVLRIKRQKNMLEFSLTCVDGGDLKDTAIVLFDGVNYLIVDDLSSGYEATVDIENLALLVIRGGAPVCFSKRGRCHADKDLLWGYYLGAISGENKPCADYYDDEAIATENYYLKGDTLGESKKTACDADLEAQGLKGEQKAYYEAKACGNEAHQKHAAKPYDYANTAPCPTQGGGIPCEASQGFFERRQREFLSGLNLAKPFLPLQNLILDSKFYPVENAKRPYYFGVIYLSGAPAYLAYAVTGDIGDIPKGFECAKFIPNDYFDKSGGYYLLLQDALTGKSIV